MKFEFHNQAMRLTPETDRERRILREEFYSAYISHTWPSFLYLTAYDADFVKRIIVRLQRLPPMWVESNECSL